MGDANATLPETDDLPSLAALLRDGLETAVKAGAARLAVRSFNTKLLP
jgi:hypothetical protein